MKIPTETIVAEMLQLVPVHREALDDLLARMTSPDRRYHGLGHLAVLWSRHIDVEQEPEFKCERAMRLAACAIAFHDAIFDTTRSDNEERSALLWRQAAANGSLSRQDVDWVDETILATRDHLACPSQAASWRDRLRHRVLDLDLSPLGECPREFAQNTELLRQENSHLSPEEWEESRLGFLRKYAAARSIYRRPEFASRFETPARANIARELAFSLNRPV